MESCSKILDVGHAVHVKSCPRSEIHLCLHRRDDTTYQTLHRAVRPRSNPRKLHFDIQLTHPTHIRGEANALLLETQTYQIHLILQM